MKLEVTSRYQDYQVIGKEEPNKFNNCNKKLMIFRVKMNSIVHQDQHQVFKTYNINYF